ncbi:MAG: hypothetical protein EON56_01860, partial [Alphaproteobacteria bacterium]
MRPFALLIALCLSAGLQPVLADDAQLSFGGDQFSAGQLPAITKPVQHDAFVVGSEVTLSGEVSGDAHLAGFN